MDKIKSLAKRIKEGDKRALARAITLIENQTDEGNALLNSLGVLNDSKAHIIGITGPPGAGKSTLVNKMVEMLLKNNHKVGVIAVDPSSPFSGGAVLGDRIRMLDQTLKENFYMRSMGSRGHLGGVAAVTLEVLFLYEHFGFDTIIVETVGAGQSEVEIAELCDTTIVVVVPGLGDSIQHIKAGIMEIADIFVINKSDMPNAERLANQLHSMLTLIPSENPIPPIIKVIATNGTGIPTLLDSIQKRKEKLVATGTLMNAKKNRILKALRNRVLSTISSEILYVGDDIAELLLLHKTTWNVASNLLLEDLIKRLSQNNKS